ncbi:ribonuclease HIII [Mammaliicoccus stepanovicii]|uniref:Ribonuclease HIII n=1 Tax=Mammaliicoccus stepanovicii TaxID=643214 RepID=A0A239ZNF5_9STAP|nr:ribonuclease HIII [Mammaliicoccus stepanovicii]PNZ79228.1 ribonuclease HIII [Mammaliicoccus stepanovicii]GGI41531.1 ribonuclease HIII [Mammaliicoccus stepanovicii]SNV72086.1 ribonuclease HIII [Mammaliicoccus stepanovicii]
MANIVKVIDSTTINNIIEKYNMETSNLPTGTLAKKKIKSTQVQIYRSKKIMFQGKDAEQVARDVLGIKIESSNEKQTHAKANYDFDIHNTIGSDEAGSGDYFGPLTVCAAYVTKKNAQILKTLGVMDSKNLTDIKIVELAEQIINICPHSLIVLDNVNYNIKQLEGWSQVKMKAVLHNQAITNVISRIESNELEQIVIDQFVQRTTYERYIIGSMPRKDITYFETKGESKSIAIAAASIIARYAFVKHMDQLSHDLNMTIPKGASNKVDLQAAKIAQKYDLDKLDHITKKHFKNRDKVLDLLNKKRRH